MYDFPDANIVFFRNTSKKARLLSEQSLGSGLTGQESGTEGRLEIVSSGIGIHIHDLAAEIQPGDKPGLHGFGKEFVRIDTTGSNHASLVTDKTVYGEVPLF